MLVWELWLPALSVASTVKVCGPSVEVSVAAPAIKRSWSRSHGWSGKASREIHGAPFRIGKTTVHSPRCTLGLRLLLCAPLSLAIFGANSMNIHEYQAKEVLRGFGVPVPKGKPAFTVEEAVKAALAAGGRSA